MKGNAAYGSFYEAVMIIHFLDIWEIKLTIIAITR